ncbi:MAG: ABC transporter substrate-binding protein [Spirochaetes bacterium]|nr:ABC transporter substrate-binding protein [Spirochaetota bacterium]
MKRLFIFIFGIIFILTTGSGLLHAKTVKVGVISPRSGPVAYFGLSIYRSVEMAIENINKNGTFGNNGPGIKVGNQRYQIEVESYDDGANPSKSVAGMRRLVEMYNVPVIFGPFGTPATWACQEVNMKLNVLFAGLSASDKSRKKGNTLYFQERLPAIYWGSPMAEAAIKKGYKRVCIVADVNEAYTSWAQKFQTRFEKLGGKVLGFEIIDSKNITDYHSIMTSFNAKKPDIIFLSLYEEPQALAASHAMDIGYKGKFFLNSDWGKKSEKIVGLDRLEGSLVEATQWMYYQAHPEKDTKGYLTEFLKQYKKKYGDIPAQPGAHIYGMVYMAVRAMELSGSVDDAKNIRAAAPKALQEGKLPLIFPNTDVLDNGLVYGAPDFLLEIKNGDYVKIQELQVPRKDLE